MRTLRGLRDFLSERTVVELIAAFLLASVAVELLHALVEFVLTAAWPQADSLPANPLPPYAARIGSHYLYYESALAWLLTLVLALAALQIVVRRLGLRGWAPGALRECPHCLATIPVAARVCGSCTRDVAPA
jgi:hypothetical protein